MIVKPWHDFPPAETALTEERLYAFNRAAIGRHDGEGLAFVLREDSEIVGVAAGYSWAGIAELRQTWIAERLRGKGHGRVLLNAFIDDARRRKVKRIWVASFSFQAPGFYEKAGFRRLAELEGFPDGHSNVILRLSPAAE